MALEQVDELAARQLGAEYGLLFCRRHLVPMYARLGWKLIEAELTYRQPGGARIRRGPVMVKPLAAKEFPTGPIDLRGLPL